MAKKIESKDLLESPERIQEKLEGIEHWAERNPRFIIGVLTALVVVVAGYFGWKYYIDKQEAEAQKEMFQAVYYFEADSLKLALHGDGNNLGFLQIINDFGLTKAGKLASYYAGFIYLKQGDYPLAISNLKKFNADDILVQARAYSLIGDAYMQQKDYDNAATWYEKASNDNPNKEFTPTYLMKAALAYEKANKNDKAVDIYTKVINTYWDTNDSQTAKKYKARLEPNS